MIRKINIKKHDVLVFTKDNNSKNTLLFIHGYNSSYRFIGMLEDLAKNYNIVSISLPGSIDVPTNEKLSIDLFVSIIEEIITKYIKNSDVYLLGHSLGGALAAKCGKIKKVKKIIFLCPVHPYIYNSLSLKVLKNTVNPETRLQKVGLGAVKSSALFFQKFFNNNLQLSKFIDPDNPWVSITNNFLLNEHEILEQLKMDYLKIAKKSYFIGGEKDFFVDSKSLKNFVEDVMKKELIIVSSGHNPITEKAQEISDIIDNIIPFKKRWFAWINPIFKS